MFLSTPGPHLDIELKFTFSFFIGKEEYRRGPLWTGLLVFFFFVSCAKPQVVREKRTDIEEKSLRHTENSIENMSPGAYALIRHGQAQARDSLTYYDYELCFAKYYLLSPTLDSMIPYIGRTLHFVSRQKTSPRINGLKALAYEYLADYNYRLYRNPQKGVELRKVAYQSLLKSDNLEFLPELCANMADTYTQMNAIPQAASWYRRALFLVDSLQLPKVRNITLYMGLAQIYMALGDDVSALHYYQETGRYFRQMKPNMRSYYLNNFGNYYYYCQDYPKALQLFLRLKTMLVHEGQQHVIDMYLCKLNLADVYLNLGKVPEAKYYLDQAEPFFVKNHVDIAVYYAHTIRIGIAIREKKLSLVDAVLKQEKVLEPSNPNMVSIREKYLRDYHLKTGKFRLAYESLQRSIAQKDSVEKQRGNMRASEIMMRFSEDTLSLHHKLALERKDAQVRRANMAVMGATGTALTFGLLLVIWSFYARKRKLESQMSILQLRMANARNRISPHFIFNVLNNRINNASQEEAKDLMGLVKLIRANLEVSKNTCITLREELDFVQYYVSAERCLLGDDFEFEIYSPSEEILERTLIPSMFVQILVENAIKHGLKDKTGYKVLQIRVTPTATSVEIGVRDNGPGFDIRRTNHSSTKTGLNVIRQTLMLVNARNRHKMNFRIENICDSKGRIVGCESMLRIPFSMNLKDITTSV